MGKLSLVLAFTNSSYGHGYIKASKLGNHINFMQANLASFSYLGYTAGEFDVATLYHSLWYFPSQASICNIFKHTADAGVRHLCLAEYSLQSSQPEQVPHILTAHAQALFHTLWKSAATGSREPNICTALTPVELLNIAFVTSLLFQEWIYAEGLTEVELLVAAISEVEDCISKLRARGVEQWETTDIFWAVLKLESPV
ncbi:hypothetical protein BDW68DRAFT_192437 [Aspergillus falconensis]